MEVKAEYIGANCYQIYEWICGYWNAITIIHADDEHEAISKYCHELLDQPRRFEDE